MYDTFEGLPEPTKDDPDYEIAREFTGRCRGTLDEVEDLFRLLKIDGFSRYVKGRFEDSLPGTKPDAVAVLHLDGDWYQSVRVCLDSLWDRVSKGGIVQIDDYGHWAGARKAVDSFLHERGIRVRLQYLDYTGRQLVKEA